jgi:hypothetical protein
MTAASDVHEIRLSVPRRPGKKKAT